MTQWEGETEKRRKGSMKEASPGNGTRGYNPEHTRMATGKELNRLKMHTLTGTNCWEQYATFTDMDFFFSAGNEELLNIYEQTRTLRIYTNAV